MAFSLPAVWVMVWAIASKTPEPILAPHSASNRSLIKKSPEFRKSLYSLGWPQAVPPIFTPPNEAVEESEGLPEAWEEPLFEILTDDKRDMGSRNSRLLEMATKTAVGVPSVQRECLSHLAFGLSDSDQGTFLALIKNPSIPENIRADFFGEVLNMRPSFLSGWLSDKMKDHTEGSIRSLAREYLTDLHAQN